MKKMTKLMKDNIAIVIFLFSLVLRIFPFLYSPFIYHQDSYWHIRYAQTIQDLGLIDTVNTTPSGQTYVYFVGMHVLFIFISNITTLGIYDIALILSPLCGSLATVGIYKLAKNLIRKESNEEIAILIGFFYSIGDIILLRSAIPIPSNYSVCSFIFGLWVLTTNSLSFKYRILFSFPLLLYSLVTHHLTGLFVLILLPIVFWTYILKEERKQTLRSIEFLIFSSLSLILNCTFWFLSYQFIMFASISYDPNYSTLLFLLLTIFSFLVSPIMVISSQKIIYRLIESVNYNHDRSIKFLKSSCISLNIILVLILFYLFLYNQVLPYGIITKIVYITLGVWGFYFLIKDEKYGIMNINQKIIILNYLVISFALYGLGMLSGFFGPQLDQIFSWSGFDPNKIFRVLMPHRIFEYAFLPLSFLSGIVISYLIRYFFPSFFKIKIKRVRTAPYIFTGIIILIVILASVINAFPARNPVNKNLSYITSEEHNFLIWVRDNTPSDVLLIGPFFFLRGAGSVFSERKMCSQNDGLSIISLWNDIESIKEHLVTTYDNFTSFLVFYSSFREKWCFGSELVIDIHVCYSFTRDKYDKFDQSEDFIELYVNNPIQAWIWTP